MSVTNTQNIVRTLLSWLFVFVLALPILQKVTKALPQLSLYNVGKEGALKRPTWKAIKINKFQPHFEKWFMHNSGLWETLVKIHNTVNYHMFNIVSSRYGGETWLGAEKALHDKIYLYDMNGLIYGQSRRKTPIPDPAERAKSIKEVQDFFESKGKVFLVVLHPIKPIVHPEWVSSNERIGKPRARYFPKFLEELKKNQVKYVYFKQPDEKQTPIFTKSGAHLTSFGKCLSARDSVDLITSIQPKLMSRFDCVPSGKLVPPYGEDLDLLRLLNAWGVEASTSGVPDFNLERKSPELKSDARLLAIGTSYVFGLLKEFDKARAFKDTTFLFYQKSRIAGREIGTPKERRGVKPFSKNYHKIPYALDHDVIILESTESRAFDIGFGFIDSVKAQLKQRAQKAKK